MQECISYGVVFEKGFKITYPLFRLANRKLWFLIVVLFPYNILIELECKCDPWFKTTQKEIKK